MKVTAVVWESIGEGAKVSVCVCVCVCVLVFGRMSIFHVFFECCVAS